MYDMAIPAIGSLTFGSIINYEIEKMHMHGTKIPYYGFCSTVMCSEDHVDQLTKRNYLFFLIVKGMVYIGIFALLLYVFHPRFTRVY